MVIPTFFIDADGACFTYTYCVHARFFGSVLRGTTLIFHARTVFYVNDRLFLDTPAAAPVSTDHRLGVAPCLRHSSTRAQQPFLPFETNIQDSVQSFSYTGSSRQSHDFHRRIFP